ncbi:hypothetical protein [Streptomyces goshikiensis]|uniref:hypothetical protein n=1 Tax=Streptomyces goshikiensis TaxID=1942 RepID=UPI0036B1C4AF
MTEQHPRGWEKQAALFPVTVTTVRREIVVARPDGGPLTGRHAAARRLVGTGRDGAA